jgi:hypothetical protein
VWRKIRQQAMTLQPPCTQNSGHSLKKQSIISSNLWLFFPEGLIAGFLALATPFWAIKLLINGHFLAACALVASIAACGYGFGWAIVNKQKYLVYLSMACFLFLAWGIDASLTS